MNTNHSRFVALLTACVLSGSALLATPTHAQNNPYSKWRKKTTPTPTARPTARPTVVPSRAYIPTRGGSTRQAIADAMRRDVGKFAGIYVIFTFTHVKANGDWAYAEAQPSSPNGKNQYEPVSALLKRTGTSWKVVDRVAGEGDSDPKVALKQLKTRNPKAPGDIFPR